jgi:hypothetical protein
MLHTNRIGERNSTTYNRLLFLSTLVIENIMLGEIFNDPPSVKESRAGQIWS